MATTETETIESSRIDDSEVTMPASAGISTAPTVPARRLFSVEEYYKLAEVGILKRQERVELIEGEIIVMSPIGESHYGGVSFLSYSLTLILRDRGLVVAQGPVRLNERSEPEPDIAVLKSRDDFYRSGLPGPSDVYFLIEVDICDV